MKVQVKSQIF